jgi:hypothetical protein
MDDGERRKQRLANQARLRQLARTRGADVEIFCSHDVAEFERLAGISPAVPTPRHPEVAARPSR